MDDDDPIPEAILCDVCKPIFAEHSYERSLKTCQNRDDNFIEEKDIPRLPHHPSLQSFKDAQSKHCSICSQFNLRKSSKDPFPLKYYFQIRSKDKAPPREGLHYEFRIETSEGMLSTASAPWGYPHIDFEIKSSPLVPCWEELVDRSLCRTWTGHKDVAALASAWLNDCKNNHPNCSQSYSKGWKPTRLLDVSEEGKVRLVEGKSVSAGQAYATLSHCWGTAEFLVLSAHNKRRFEEGMKTSEFPLTFRETIQTVRRLGLNYLWVDCYCIIQGRDDDRARQDWKYESLQMEKVYTNSLLNIGALLSNGPAGGLFRIRTYPLRCRILWSPAGHIGPKNFLFNLDTKNTANRVRWSQISGSNLMRRGWVIQECVLAPRMLSFGPENILWQCSQQAAADFLDQPTVELGKFHPSWTQSYPFWMLSDIAPIRRRRVYDIKARWMSTLASYLESRLTYPEKDVFVALNGIGTEVAKSSGTSFKNGMLTSTLPEALLHRSSSHYERRRDVSKPTWHWSHLYPEVDVYDIRLLYEQLTAGGRLILRMAYAFMSDDCKPLPTEDSIDYWPKCFLIGRLATKLPSSARKFYDGKWYDDVLSKQREFYVPIIGLLALYVYELKLSGLILVPSESGAFRRAGIWFIDSKPETLELYNRTCKTRPRMIVLE
ncbi:heterokaryon incompatibility protein-domain-containing protein [Nemania abortiva]|nr:heterokaryon incompatibility protein-domain-containing protein [Nemania abortiva]